MRLRPVVLALVVSLALPAAAGAPVAPMLPLKPGAAKVARQKNAKWNKLMANAHQKLRFHFTARQWLTWHRPVPSAAEVGAPAYPGAKLLHWGYKGGRKMGTVTLISAAPAKQVFAWYQAHLKGWGCAVNTWTCRPPGHSSRDFADQGVQVFVQGRQGPGDQPVVQEGLLVVPHDWKTQIFIVYKAAAPKTAHRHAAHHPRPHHR